MTVADWIQTFLLVATIIGLIITIANNRKQLQIFNQQLKLNFFADYTKRYQEIILNFPENINEDSFDFDKLPKEERNKTLRYMRAYFDLCSEEFDLWKAGYIEQRIWENWKMGIEFAFSKKAFKDGWKLICLDTIYYPDFVKWIDKVVKADNEKLELKELEKIKEKKEASR